MCRQSRGFPQRAVARICADCSEPRKTGESILSAPSRTWMCLICGFIYDESAGDPEHGIAPGTAWADVPMNWTCPECGARKEDFELVAI